jgi:hypothetical protein
LFVSLFVIMGKRERMPELVGEDSSDEESSEGLVDDESSDDEDSPEKERAMADYARAAWQGVNPFISEGEREAELVEAGSACSLTDCFVA